MIGQKTEAIDMYWQTCRERHGIEATAYHASTFADPDLAPYHDTLLKLVQEGRKRATAHLLEDFRRSGVPRRAVGNYWVIVDSDNAPRYLVRVTDVEVKPFNQVEAAFAAREGEGDNSLQYWRDVHRDYFQQQCARWGIAWDENYLTVCEGFELIQ